MSSRLFASPLLVAASLVATFAAAPVLAADYVQAPGSSLVFASKYDGEVFTGKFPGFDTTLSFDPANLAGAKLDVRIPLASAISGNNDRDSTCRGRTSSTSPSSPPRATAPTSSAHSAATSTRPTARWNCAVSASRSR
ncbi:hypothetical protein XPU_1974 [Xanthomonas arboricola pv. pruni str. MAFF 311562]|uniref:Lipid/polyisoprenoid-binding YceI-like domain-containing protein n=1 Tax=Xanthomonas arboricola pv. pruni str. MAFF 311562 TaxID=1414836 RepID=W4S250_9XANT|nr:hypothetical protein XPU_1974 [Xanthomonas arboricola pv. pruni str. MAFF 311562]